MSDFSDQAFETSDLHRLIAVVSFIGARDFLQTLDSGWTLADLSGTGKLSRSNAWGSCVGVTIERFNDDCTPACVLVLIGENMRALRVGRARSECDCITSVGG